MKFSTKLCAYSVVCAAIAMPAFATDKSHTIGMTSASGNKGFGATNQACPAGETVATGPATGKQNCVKSDAARTGVMPSVGGLRNAGPVQSNSPPPK
jgi:hypothetical protein